MGKFFNAESPFMRFLIKMSDIVFLNFIFLVCCIPVFTIGASLCGLYYVTMRMNSNEEGYVIRNFFQGFKQNFKQATLAWLGMLVLIIIFVLDGVFCLGSENILGYGIVLVIIGLLVLAFTGIYLFPMIARFEDSLLNQIRNALFISVLQIPRTLIMIIFSAIPFVLLGYNLKWFPLLLLGAFSLVAYANSGMMLRIFEKYMPQQEKKGDESRPKDRQEKETKDGENGQKQK